MITSSPRIAHERSLLLEFLTSHRITGEILVYEMKTWQSGSVRERPMGQCHTHQHTVGHAPGPVPMYIASLHSDPVRWQPHRSVRHAKAMKGSLWQGHLARKCQHCL